MKSLARAARPNQDQGEFLPLPLRPLADMKIRVRSGTATFIAGPPGAAKTMFTLYNILRMNKPTLFFSADCEPFEIVERAAAAMSGQTMDFVRQNPQQYVEGLATYCNNVKFVYDDAPSYLDVELEVAAYAEVYGQFPEIIVIDNLMNLVGQSEDEWSSHRDHAKVIHRLTRITKAALIVLAHMSDDRTDASHPAPRKSLMGKVGALPKVILSLAMCEESPGVWKILVAPVKSRWSSADPSGKTYAEVYCDPSRSRLFNSRTDLMNGVPA